MIKQINRENIPAKPHEGTGMEIKEFIENGFDCAEVILAADDTEIRLYMRARLHR